MSIPSTSLLQMAYVPETTWGTTPATPALQVLRLTKESMVHGRETSASGEIRSDRNIPDLIHTGGSASGGFEFELSYGTLDALLESALQDAWTDNVLKNGVTRKPFTFEKRVPASDGSYEYFRFTGMEASTFKLSIAARSIITGSMDFIGMGGSVGQTLITDATYPAANTEAIMSASSQFASLAVGSLSTLAVSSLELDIDNGLEALPVAGSLNPVDLRTGQFKLTGTLEAYFADSDLYNLFLNGTSAALSFTLGSVTTKKYAVSIPSIKFSSGEVVAGSATESFLAKMQFQGLYSAADAATLKITRAVA